MDNEQFDEHEEPPDEFKSDDIPDGGWGWFVCCGTFIVNFIVFGIHNSFGVIYANLLDELGLGKAETAWIGAMAMGLNFFCGPIASLLCNRYSCRTVACVGALLSVLGLLLTSFVQEASKMYVTYGLLFGVGSSFSFVPSIVVLGEYFRKRLAFVNGLATSGSGVGSLVAGPVINYLLGTTGWQNSMRMLSGFAMLFWVAAFLYRPNAKLRTRRRQGKLFDLKIWKNKAYVMWVVTVAMFQFGYLVPFVHLVKYAEDLGIPKANGAWLVGFLSVMSIVGRIVFGKISDIRRINRLYLFQFSMFAIGVSTILCPLAKSYGGLIAYSLTFGFFDGCFVGQVAVITADIVGHENLSQGVGSLFGCIAIPMSLGPPVAAWMYDGFGSYNVAFYLSGSMALLSTLLLYVVAYLLRIAKPNYEDSQLTQNSAEMLRANIQTPSVRASSGYSSSPCESSEFEVIQPLVQGERLRELFRDTERETVL